MPGNGDSSTAVSLTTYPLFFSLLLLCRWSCLHEVMCAEYRKITKGDLLFFMMNIGCASRGPTIHVVCGDHSLFRCYLDFLLLWVLHFLLRVCVPSVRGAG
ncbi:mucin-associated surface protein (MASP), putative, partial [Trypanosoma cruzi marinkellei]